MTQEPRHDGRGIYHDDFRLSITKALGDQLADALSRLGPVPLTEENLSRLDERPGVYQLYLCGEFVYVGKAERSLPSRLRNHLRKISGRRNIELVDIAFSCLYVAEDFSALAPEQLLISHHKEIGGIPWNNNGFGNKDPGRQRDTTILKKGHFDLIYPIDLDIRIERLMPGEYTLTAFLRILKLDLPYNFRYAEPDQSEPSTLEVQAHNLSADNAFHMLSKKLSGKWQIATLMGYVIMYPESPKEYGSAWRYYRAGQTIDSVPEASAEELTSDDALELEG
jgi:hypothetical protein